MVSSSVVVTKPLVTPILRRPWRRTATAGASGSTNLIADLRDAATNEAFSAYVLADDISRNASVTDVEAVDLVYAYILTLIEDDHWSLLTPFFDGFHVATAPVVVMLAPLTITVDCRARISERRRYFDREAGELVRRREPQILELLQGLE